MRNLAKATFCGRISLVQQDAEEEVIPSRLDPEKAGSLVCASSLCPKNSKKTGQVTSGNCPDAKENSPALVFPASRTWSFVCDAECVTISRVMTTRKD
jgi:hypothetical protein